MIDNTHPIELERQWTNKFPTTLSGLFSFYQCLCTIAILGCEIGSILIDLYNATIYIGIWASLFFTIAWIVQAISASCRQSYQCATITLILQCIALVFAACVIGFDAYFLINPTACFFSSTSCSSQAPTRGLFYTVDNFNNVKIPLIKGQLAIAVLMFAFSVDYIIMYVVIRVHIKNRTRAVLKPVVRTGTKNRMSMNVAISNTAQANRNPPILPTKNGDNLTPIEIFSDSSVRKSLNRSRWSSDSINLSPSEV